jgi:hypothetical protein
MRSFKAVFGVIAALLPLAYCGYLLLYFKQVSGETGPVETGLGPTMLGLGAVALLLAIPLLLKIVKLFAGTPGGQIAVEESSFDPDAALARYLARKAAGGVEVPPADPPPPGGFGRKTV